MSDSMEEEEEDKEHSVSLPKHFAETKLQREHTHTTTKNQGEIKNKVFSSIEGYRVRFPSRGKKTVEVEIY